VEGSWVYFKSRSRYCLIKAVFGGWDNKEVGNIFGNELFVKKSSLRSSWIVALLEGSLINILEINCLISGERLMESGKL